MKAHLIVYGSGYALNRSATLLFLPLATHSLSLGDFGIFCLVQAFVQLTHPLFCLNGGEAIIREGSNNNRLGDQLLSGFTLVALIIAILVIPIAYFGFTPLWLKWGTIISVLEGLGLLLLSWWRTRDMLKTFAAFSICKFLSMVTIFSLALIWDKGLVFLLQAQALAYLGLFLFFAGLTFIHVRGIANIRPYLAYSLILLPNGVAQWIMSSSDRFMIDFVYNKELVGEYSLAYNLSMVIMLLNGGMSMGLPPIVFRQYQDWTLSKNRIRFFGRIALLNIITFSLLLCGIWLDANHFHIIAYYPENIFPLVTWCFAGMFLLSFYYIYSTYIYFHRQPRVLLNITLVAATANIVATLTFLPQLGIIGAAIATFLSYGIFLAMTALAAQKLESKVRIDKSEVLIIASGLGFIFFFGRLF